MNNNPTHPVPIQRRPLYLQTLDQMRALLKGCATGQRIETEAELLAKLNVSVLTLRRAMGELEREGIIERRQGSGTFYLGDVPIARKHVGVLLDVDDTSPHLSAYFPALCRKIRKELTKEGIASRSYLGDLPLGVEPTGLTCADFYDDVRLGRVCGLISFFTYREPGWVSLLRKHNIPFIDPQASYELCPKSGFLPWAVDLALQNNRRKVAALTWESPTDNVHPFSRELTALAEKNGIELVRSWLDISVNGWEPGMGWERFRDIWRSSPEKPNMLIVGDDMVFADIQQAITELGIRVPEDLLVVMQGSDAITIDPQFPVAQYVMKVDKLARHYAMTIKAMINGTAFESPVQSELYEIRFSGFENVSLPSNAADADFSVPVLL